MPDKTLRGAESMEQSQIIKYAMQHLEDETIKVETAIDKHDALVKGYITKTDEAAKRDLFLRRRELLDEYHVLRRMLDELQG